ncbi:hypothetical protein ACIRPT_13825 [Streptomyces sp. NPDC101227]|uniref:hypothetical protein n=1 Tax=Streptomyces sp. NPDC101227 TaxID=3366136 RepID=UPI0037FE4178
MNDPFNGVATESEPLFWYALPDGYRRVDLDSSPEGLEAVARQIRELPEEEGGESADRLVRLYALAQLKLRKHEVLDSAFAVHPEGEGAGPLSVITVSRLPMPGVNPAAVLTKMLADSAGAGTDEGLRPVELPVGTGFLVESERRAAPPEPPAEGPDEPLEGAVWQGLVAVPDSVSSSVITVQLVTGSVELADDCREVLLGTARTLSLTDPEADDEESGSGAGHGATETVRSVFG